MTGNSQEPKEGNQTSSDPFFEPTAPLTPEERSLVEQIVADALSIQSKFLPEPLYKHLGTGHYERDTVGVIRREKESKEEL